MAGTARSRSWRTFAAVFMGYYDRSYGRRPFFGSANSALITLIAINMIIFIALAFAQAIFMLKAANGNEGIAQFRQEFLSLFTLPADLHSLGSRPWAPLSYMFVHSDFWHIFSNMLWLWTFGYILQDLTGDRKLFPVYLYGGLAGALAFVATFNLAPALKEQLPYASLLGASAGTMAIAVAATVIAPGYRIFPMLAGGIPLWVITGIYLVIDLATLPFNNIGGHISHLAGALMGFLFMYFFRMGYDWGEWMSTFWDWLTNLFNPDRPSRKRKAREELFYRSGSEPFVRTPNVTEKKIDEILDKIHQQGYAALSEEEKDLLKRASEKDA